MEDDRVVKNCSVGPDFRYKECMCLNVELNSGRLDWLLSTLLISVEREIKIKIKEKRSVPLVGN